jgi:2Fe-2S ferredoxin
MPRITLIEHNGTEHTVDATVGESLMLAATQNAVPGIDADCGGACACGTCHVLLAQEWVAATGEPDAMEEAMLSMRPDRAPTSRLGCQIDITDAMDGMIVQLPEYQM